MNLARKQSGEAASCLSSGSGDSYRMVFYDRRNDVKYCDGKYSKEALMKLAQSDCLRGSLEIDSSKAYGSYSHMIVAELKETLEISYALVTGKWILKPEFIVASYNAKKWLNERDFMWEPDSGQLGRDAAKYEQCLRIATAAKAWRHISTSVRLPTLLMKDWHVILLELHPSAKSAERKKRISRHLNHCCADIVATYVLDDCTQSFKAKHPQLTHVQLINAEPSKPLPFGLYRFLLKLVDQGICVTEARYMVDYAMLKEYDPKDSVVMLNSWKWADAPLAGWKSPEAPSPVVRRPSIGVGENAARVKLSSRFSFESDGSASDMLTPSPTPSSRSTASSGQRASAIPRLKPSLSETANRANFATPPQQLSASQPSPQRRYRKLELMNSPPMQSQAPVSPPGSLRRVQYTPPHVKKTRSNFVTSKSETQPLGRTAIDTNPRNKVAAAFRPSVSLVGLAAANPPKKAQHVTPRQKKGVSPNVNLITNYFPVVSPCDLTSPRPEPAKAASRKLPSVKVELELSPVKPLLQSQRKDNNGSPQARKPSRGLSFSQPERANVSPLAPSLTAKNTATSPVQAAAKKKPVKNAVASPTLLEKHSPRADAATSDSSPTQKQDQSGVVADATSRITLPPTDKQKMADAFRKLQKSAEKICDIAEKTSHLNSSRPLISKFAASGPVQLQPNDAKSGSQTCGSLPQTSVPEEEKKARIEEDRVSLSESLSPPDSSRAMNVNALKISSSAKLAAMKLISPCKPKVPSLNKTTSLNQTTSDWKSSAISNEVSTPSLRKTRSDSCDTANIFDSLKLDDAPTVKSASVPSNDQSLSRRATGVPKAATRLPSICGSDEMDDSPELPYPTAAATYLHCAAAAFSPCSAIRRLRFNDEADEIVPAASVPILRAVAGDAFASLDWPSKARCLCEQISGALSAYSAVNIRNEPRLRSLADRIAKEQVDIYGADTFTKSTNLSWIAMDPLAAFPFSIAPATKTGPRIRAAKSSNSSSKIEIPLLHFASRQVFEFFADEQHHLGGIVRLHSFVNQRRAVPDSSVMRSVIDKAFRRGAADIDFANKSLDFLLACASVCRPDCYEYRLWWLRLFAPTMSARKTENVAAINALPIATLCDSLRGVLSELLSCIPNPCGRKGRMHAYSCSYQRWAHLLHFLLGLLSLELASFVESWDDSSELIFSCELERLPIVVQLLWSNTRTLGTVRPPLTTFLPQLIAGLTIRVRDIATPDVSVQFVCQHFLMLFAETLRLVDIGKSRTAMAQDNRPGDDVLEVREMHSLDTTLGGDLESFLRLLADGILSAVDGEVEEALAIVLGLQTPWLCIRLLATLLERVDEADAHRIKDNLWLQCLVNYFYSEQLLQLK